MALAWRLPLSPAILNDPAFSSDPRVHPHFPHPFPPRPKARAMTALVRSLTTRHYNLDRIDELDETDPFGASYHHDGPYEAIGSAPHVPANVRQSTLRSLHPPQRKPPPIVPVPFVHAEMGLSLHLEPGQILQHNTIYASCITSAPSHLPRRSNTVAVQPDHPRGHPPPIPRTRSLRDDLHNRPSFPRAPPERYLTDNMLNIHHDHDAVRQTEMTISPPPRHESLLPSGPSRSPQRTPPPSSIPTPRKTHLTENTIPALPPHDPRYKGTNLDSSCIINNTTTQSPPSMSLEHPRIRHLPKRLVMPAPLRPQPPTQHKFPQVDPLSWQDGQHPTLEQRLLRKTSSISPERNLISHHVPISQDDAMPTMATTLTKIVNEAEGTKEKMRRRKLSKRKNDI